MSIASDIIAEVKPTFIQQGIELGLKLGFDQAVTKGKAASLSEILETFCPILYDRYKDQLASVRTPEDFEELKTEIYKRWIRIKSRETHAGPDDPSHRR